MTKQIVNQDNFESVLACLFTKFKMHQNLIAIDAILEI